MNSLAEEEVTQPNWRAASGDEAHTVNYQVPSLHSN
jgi:hypothetical protein